MKSALLFKYGNCYLPEKNIIRLNEKANYIINIILNIIQQELNYLSSMVKYLNEIEKALDF